MISRSMIIFGGTQGIGHRLAAHYKNTFKVSIAGRHPKAQGMRGKINVIKADVSKEKNVKAAFDRHLKKWGNNPDVVINCAAIQGPIGNSWEIRPRKIEETLKINLLGSFIVSQAAIKRMITQGHGSIILFSGGGAAYGRPQFNAYAASKTGVLRMVEGMAEELKTAGYPCILINAIAPGAVKTAMTAGQAIENGGTPTQEIVNLVDFFIDRKINKGLTGRLVHVREDYRQLVKKWGTGIPDDIGKIRRVPIK